MQQEDFRLLGEALEADCALLGIKTDGRRMHRKYAPWIQYNAWYICTMQIEHLRASARPDRDQGGQPEGPHLMAQRETRREGTRPRWCERPWVVTKGRSGEGSRE